MPLGRQPPVDPAACTWLRRAVPLEDGSVVLTFSVPGQRVAAPRAGGLFGSKVEELPAVRTGPMAGDLAEAFERNTACWVALPLQPKLARGCWCRPVQLTHLAGRVVFDLKPCQPPW